MPSKFKLDAIDSIGAGLFNEQSKATLRTDYDVIFIPYENLRVAKDNTYSVSGIDELADSIATAGLQQNLAVSTENSDGTYDILAGQRRYLAIGELLKKDNKVYERVPCVVIDAAKIDFGVAVPDAIKSLYVVATTNQYRDMTDADRALLIAQLSQVYEAVKAAGGTDKISLRKREFIAQEMNISPRTVQTFLTAEKKLKPELSAMFKDGKMSLATASTVSDLPKEKQAQLINIVQEAAEEDALIDIAETAKTLATQKKSTQKQPVYHDSYIINHNDLAFISNLPPSLHQCMNTAANGLPIAGASKKKIDAIKADIQKQYAKLEKVLNQEIAKYEKN